MNGYNVKIQEFYNGEVKFSIYPDGINYIPDEFKSYIENLYVNELKSIREISVAG